MTLYHLPEQNRFWASRSMCKARLDLSIDVEINSLQRFHFFGLFGRHGFPPEFLTSESVIWFFCQDSIESKSDFIVASFAQPSPSSRVPDFR